jgi:hypothetical protein
MCFKAFWSVFDRDTNEASHNVAGYCRRSYWIIPFGDEAVWIAHFQPPALILPYFFANKGELRVNIILDSYHGVITIFRIPH